MDLEPGEIPENDSSEVVNAKERVFYCSTCKVELSKYKCPGCSARSCSITCVKEHKVQTGCTGRRNRAAFIPISSFTENDYADGTNLHKTSY